MKHFLLSLLAVIICSSLLSAEDPQYDLWKLRDELPRRVLTDPELDALLDAGWVKLYSFGAWYASGEPGPEYHQKFSNNLRIQATLRNLEKIKSSDCKSLLDQLEDLKRRIAALEEAIAKGKAKATR